MRRSAFFALIVVAVSAAINADDIRLPDASSGEIDGKRAMLVWPVAGVEITGTGAKPQKLLPPDGCETHLVPVNDLERELLYPCGKWFLPPAGTYRVWLEKPNLSTVGYGVVTYEPEPFAGRGMAMMMPLEPAGRVALAKEVPLPQSASFRLLQIRGPKNGILHAPFDRRVNAAAARTGVQMGVGTVLAAMFDRKTNDAVAIAPPLPVVAGRTAFAAPAPPTKGTDVFVNLERPKAVKPGEDEVALVLKVGAATKKPDVFMNTATRVFAVWYGVEARTASLHVDSPTLRYSAAELVLRPNKVITVRGKLEKLPSLAISIQAPGEALRNGNPLIEVRSAGANQPLRTIPATFEGLVRIESLPDEQLDVMLIVEPWEFTQAVDLSSGADASLVFDLQPIIVSGTVYHGRDRAAGAEIAFEADRDWIRTTANADGRYELVFWRPAWDYRAEVQVENREGPPFIEGFLDIQQSRTIDFHVPRTRYTVHVVDAVTKKAIADAKVTAGNAWTEREGSVIQTTTTDADGNAILPPMRQGELVIRARAEGYFDSEPSRRTVDRIDAEGHAELALNPIGATIEVQLRTADGRDAVGAEVWAVQSASGHQPPLWRGTADGRGYIAIPRAVRHALFLVHAHDAASAVRHLGDETEVVWMLDAAAPAITLKASKQARLALWLDDVRVSGVALAFLTGSLEATDPSGIWSCANLPQRPLRLLAWRGNAAVESGAYDAVATQIDYPWPQVVEVPAID